MRMTPGFEYLKIAAVRHPESAQLGDVVPLLAFWANSPLRVFIKESYLKGFLPESAHIYMG